MKKTIWRDQVFLLGVFAAVAALIVAYFYKAGVELTSVVVVVSIVASFISAASAARSADMAFEVEKRIARTERIHSVRELVRSWTRAMVAYHTGISLMQAVRFAAKSLASQHGGLGADRFKVLAESIDKEAASYELMHETLKKMPASPEEIDALPDDEVAAFQMKLDAIMVSLDAGNADLLREANRYEEESKFSRTAINR